jgi:hypothetical protein
VEEIDHDEFAPGQGGAVAMAPDTRLSAERTRFQDNLAGAPGGAVWCRGACTLIDNLFVGNHSLSQGGALYLRDGAGSVVRGNRFCDNVADARGGAMALTQGVALSELSYNVFFGNRSSGGGGALWADVGVLLYNNDFVGNVTDAQGAALFSTDGEMVALNSIIVDHLLGDDLVGRDGGDIVLQNVLFDGNLPPETDGGVDVSAVVRADPQFVGYVSSDCEGSDLHLAPASLAIGAGEGAYEDDLGAFPCLPEVPGDGVDSDCDGAELCYLDGDGDGVGGDVTATSPIWSCTEPGEASVTGDCDDADPLSFPGNVEIGGDARDGDCDGLELCWADADGDGYGAGDATVPSEALDCAAEQLAPEGGDCDDLSAEIHPGQLDDCNGLDDDCSGVADDGPVPGAWYDDLDGDGFGDPATELATCTPPSGAVSLGGDCDDTSAEVNPEAAEICDGLDNDCDDQIDPGCEQLGGPRAPDETPKIEGSAVGCGCQHPGSQLGGLAPLLLLAAFVQRSSRPFRGQARAEPW